MGDIRGAPLWRRLALHPPGDPSTEERLP